MKNGLSNKQFIIIALIIKLEDGGPVFFCQERVTINKKLFNIIKFRSMKVSSDDKVIPTQQNNIPNASIQVPQNIVPKPVVQQSLQTMGGQSVQPMVNELQTLNQQQLVSPIQPLNNTPIQQVKETA